MKTDTYLPVIKKKSDDPNYGFDKYVRPTEEGNSCFKLEFTKKKIYFELRVLIPHFFSPTDFVARWDII